MPPQTSVIIPALNEASHLSELLPLIKQQTLNQTEIIVADAGSTDGTPEVARQYGARIVEGGLPSFGRNTAAQAARGEWLVFIDADCRPPCPDLFEKALDQARARGLSAAVTDVRAHYRPGDKGHDSIIIRGYDHWMMWSQRRAQRFFPKLGFPVGTTQFMVTRRDCFLEMGGFDRTSEPFEDSNYLLRTHRQMPPPPGGRSAVGVLDADCYILVSMRRFDVHGRLIYPYYLSFRSVILRLVVGREVPIRGYWDTNHRGDFNKDRSRRDDH